MTARDDYPVTPGDMDWPGVHRMWDEIDVLRAKVKADDIVFNAINQLVKELTDHADAMRELLEDASMKARGRETYSDDKDADAFDRAVTAYDNFIKEA